MPSSQVYNQTGEAVGKVDLDPKVFGVKPNPGLIQQAVVAQLANRRQVSAHTQTKGEVRGGGRKPWAQKGTGRARHGSIRSPQWKGGGVVHGPRSDRNYSLKINAKAKRMALLMTLSDKATQAHLSVVDKLEWPEAKTKHLASLLKLLSPKKSTLLVLPTSRPEVVRAGRNIPRVRMIRADSLNVYDVVKHQRLVILQDALPVISKTFTQ